MREFERKYYSQRDVDNSRVDILSVSKEEVSANLNTHRQAAQALITAVRQALDENRIIRGYVAGDTNKGEIINTVSIVTGCDRIVRRN